MNRRTFTALRICLFALLVCALFTLGCKKDEEHTDASFLVGEWTGDSAAFTIQGDYTFNCTLADVNTFTSDIIPAQVTGNLDFSDSALGPNDYIMRNMAVGSLTDPDYGTGNSSIADQLTLFQNLTITLTPSSDMKMFTFSSADPIAQAFFGGDYIKQ